MNPGRRVFRVKLIIILSSLQHLQVNEERSTKKGRGRTVDGLITCRIAAHLLEAARHIF